MKRGKKGKPKNARDLSQFISDRTELARLVFLALKPSEIKAMAPNFAKKLPMDKLEALCRDELLTMSAKSLRSILTTTPTETVELVSDSEADNSSASGSENDSASTDSSDSDTSDDTEKSTEASDDVMVIEDDSDEDIKVHTDNKQEAVGLIASRKNSRTDKANGDTTVDAPNAGDKNKDVTDQYVDGIKKLDMLTAKIGQEIEKLSKKKENTSSLTNEYVNEMSRELTRIENEISMGRMEKRKESAEQMDMNETKEEKIRAKRKGMTGEGKSLTNRKQSKNAKSSRSNNQATPRCEEAVTVQSNSAHKPHVDTTSSISTVNRLTEEVIKKGAEENNVDAVVCLLSDSDDSQDELDSELHQSITESRKHKVLSKEKQKEKLKFVDISDSISKTLDKRKKPFSEQDIEIEIIVHGGANLDNREKPERESRKANLLKSHKNTNVVKDVSNQSGPEEGEIDLSSDDSESTEDKMMSKKRVHKVRITSKNVARADKNNEHIQDVGTSVEVNMPIDNELKERNNDSVRPQLRSTITKVTDDDWLTETKTNKLKSTVAKLPQVIKIKVGETNIKTRVLSNETNARVRDKDNITVVVKNNLKDEATHTDRIIKMTEDIKSVESVVVAVSNKVNGAGTTTDNPNKATEEKQDQNKNTKAKIVLKPVEQKCVAKAADFVFVKPKNRGKPMLMARKTDTNEKTGKSSLLDNDQDMDILDIDCVELMRDEINTAKLADSSINNIEEYIVKPNDEETLRNNSGKTYTNAENPKNALEQNAETGIDNLKLSDTITNIRKYAEPAIGIVSKTLETVNKTVSDNVEKESKSKGPRMTVEVKGSDLNNRESINETETAKGIENTKRIDDGNLMNIINDVVVESTLLNNPVLNAEDLEHCSKNIVEYKLEPLNFNTEAATILEVALEPAIEVENEISIKRAAEEVETHEIMNLESVMDHAQLDIMPITEAISLASEKLALQQEKNETVHAISEHDPALETSGREATALDPANLSPEEGELDHTADGCTPRANPALEDGEIDVENEIASKALEDGELSVHSSSDVESIEITEEIICISDEEPGQVTRAAEPVAGKLKKRKRKDKNNKNEEKKHKPCKCKEKKQNNDVDSSNMDYLEICSKDPDDILIDCKNSNSYQDVEDIVKDTSDENLAASSNVISDSSEITENAEATLSTKLPNETKDSSQDVIDILSIEISSDESSDEPVFEDLDDLTAAIDGIERQQEAEHRDSESVGDIENISWRDRYLDSRKVKRVLTTSNILNALRKKNKELKKKLLESKLADIREVTPEPAPVEEISQTNIEEGSIEHYNTLQGSSKFVDPVTDTPAEDTAQNAAETQISSGEVNGENAVLRTDLENPQMTKEMKKDAKNLLKMYKKLLKYNDMNRRKDPSKKAKKKKRNKDGTG